MKKFKAESQKLLDMMINSVYTHKEIFLRELISNAADAIDKQYYKSLNGGDTGMSREDYNIHIDIDKENRKLIISDNGCGMTDEEMEKNLGTIAHSGTNEFRSSAEGDIKNEVIGQFGVGFYSAFMVASKVEVLSRPYGSEKAYLWTSDGTDGYSIEAAEKDDFGTKITLYIKPDTDDEHYDEFLDSYRLKALIKKHSDYIRYPIIMEVETYKASEDNKGESQKVMEQQTINSMIPVWKKAKADVTDEEMNNFYSDKFHDYEHPLETIRVSLEGAVSFNALLFIPSHAPYDYYTKDYEKGLELYSNGVLIMEKCGDLLPDYFSFIKGVVDSQDLSLNISREMLQHNRQLKVIATAIEKKIKSTLLDMMANKRADYEKFFNAFGIQLKYGIYSSFGANKDKLSDLLIFRSTIDGSFMSLDEYVEKMSGEQKYIYYACGSSVDSIKNIPQLEAVTDKGYNVLALTDNVDEFLVKIIDKYKEKEFKSIQAENTGIEADEKETTDLEKDMLKFMSESLTGKVKEVRISRKLKTHPVCLSSEGEVSIEMEKVLNSMPNADQSVSAQKILEINAEHPVYNKLKALFESDKDSLKSLTEILYDQACLIEGLTIDNPSKYSEIVCSLLAK